MRETMVHIKNGEISNKSQIRRLFSELKDGPYLLTLKSKRRRSLRQNRYWWGVVVPLVFAGLRDIGWENIREH